MAKFKICKQIKLDFLGEDWKDCYISFNLPSYSETKVMAGEKDKSNKEKSDSTIELLKSKFIEGKGFTGKEVIDMTVDDIEELSPGTIAKIVTTLIGIDPNV